MLWGAYLQAGFAPAVALCAAMLTTLAVYLLDWAAARALPPRRVGLGSAACTDRGGRSERVGRLGREPTRHPHAGERARG